MSKPILCIGASPALQRTMEFERVARGGVNRARRVTSSPAGKAVNVALVLRTLGCEPLLTGFLGGSTGVLMRELLAARGVAADCVEVPHPTRICTTLVEDGSPSVTELVEEAATPDDHQWRALSSRCRDLLPRCAYAVIAGALPPNSPVDVYAMLARASRNAETPLLIDSQKQPLLAALTHGPLLAKLNAYELGLTFGRTLRSRREVADAATELNRRGAQWVLVTNGGKPALLTGASGTWKFTPPKISAINAVGSGDATTAGIAAGLIAGEPMERAVTLGLACGAANALTLTPADVMPDDVRRLREQISVRPL